MHQNPFVMHALVQNTFYLDSDILNSNPISTLNSVFNACL